MTRARRSTRQTIRKIGLMVIAVAAFAVALVGAPAGPPPVAVAGFERDLRQAIADDAVNNLRTEGAPQQTVVNGWTARDLLQVIAEQNNALVVAAQSSADDIRVPLILALMLAAAALYVLTEPAHGTLLPAPAAVDGIGPPDRLHLNDADPARDSVDDPGAATTRL